jgi:GNAT superfamily N-acetyltransferase
MPIFLLESSVEVLSKGKNELQLQDKRKEQMMVTIRQVSSKKDWNRFFSFPNELYRDNPYYVPTLIYDEKWNFNPKKNPAYEYVESVAFLALDGNEVVGRIAALINHKLNKLKSEKKIRFTRYDVIDDFSVSEALFSAVFEWGKQVDADTIIGPIGFSDLDKQGLLVEGFDQPGMFITLYNHPYYHDHLVRLGFEKEVDWVEFKVFVPEKPDERIERICDIAQKRHGYRLLEFKKKKEVIPYARQMFRMYNDSFAQLYGFCPLSDGQIDMAIKQFISLVSLEYVFIVVDKSDEVIGFGIMVPSLSQAVKKSNGRLLPLGLLRITRALKYHDILDMYLIAVKPEYLGRGVNAVILNEGIKRAIANGVKFAETGPELEDNDNVQTQWKAFKVEQHKRRRCYGKPL